MNFAERAKKYPDRKTLAQKTKFIDSEMWSMKQGSQALNKTLN